MTTTRRYPITPPVDDFSLACRNCGDPIAATAQVFDDGMSIGGLRAYEWRHVNGSDVCRPKTVAQPFDGWHATRIVESALAERQAAEDAVLDAEVSGREVVQPEEPEQAHVVVGRGCHRKRVGRRGSPGRNGGALVTLDPDRSHAAAPPKPTPVVESDDADPWVEPGCRCQIVRMPPCSWCCEWGDSGGPS